MLRNSWAVTWPGAVFSSGLTAAKVNTLPARTPEHPADDALLAHAQPDQRMAVAIFLQKLHHGHVVVESRGRADDLVEVGRVVFTIFSRVCSRFLVARKSW